MQDDAFQPLTTSVDPNDPDPNAVAPPDLQLDLNSGGTQGTTVASQLPVTVDFTADAPEPATLLPMLAGLALAVWRLRMRNRS
jgi:hypothetical protein